MFTFSYFIGLQNVSFLLHMTNLENLIKIDALKNTKYSRLTQYFQQMLVLIIMKDAKNKYIVSVVNFLLISIDIFEFTVVPI